MNYTTRPISLVPCETSAFTIVVGLVKMSLENVADWSPPSAQQTITPESVDARLFVEPRQFVVPWQFSSESSLSSVVEPFFLADDDNPLSCRPSSTIFVDNDWSLSTSGDRSGDNSGWLADNSGFPLTRFVGSVQFVELSRFLYWSIIRQSSVYSNDVWNMKMEKTKNCRNKNLISFDNFSESLSLKYVKTIKNINSSFCQKLLNCLLNRY